MRIIYIYIYIYILVKIQPLLVIMVNPKFIGSKIINNTRMSVPCRPSIVTMFSLLTSDNNFNIITY